MQIQDFGPKLWSGFLESWPCYASCSLTSQELEGTGASDCHRSRWIRHIGSKDKSWSSNVEHRDKISLTSVSQNDDLQDLNLAIPHLLVPQSSRWFLINVCRNGHAVSVRKATRERSVVFSIFLHHLFLTKIYLW